MKLVLLVQQHGEKNNKSTEQDKQITCTELKSLVLAAGASGRHGRSIVAVSDTYRDDISDGYSIRDKRCTLVSTVS